MPFKDPEKRRAYARRRYRESPEIRETKRIAEQERYRRKVSTEEGRREINARAKKWREDNPEKLAEIGRRHSLKRYYGLTLEGYDRLLDIQDGKCAICRGEQMNGQNLAVDHDHETGKVRGLLCHNCNHALGKFKDDPFVLKAAIKYLVERT